METELSLVDKRTPTPWKLTKGDRAFAFNIIHDSQNGGTAVVRDVLKEENAAFIVRAVNAHEELLSALVDLWDSHMKYASGDLTEKIISQVQSAIAKGRIDDARRTSGDCF